jgi:hypothetical protein
MIGCQSQPADTAEPAPAMSQAVALSKVVALELKRTYAGEASEIEGYIFELVNSADRFEALGLGDLGVQADLDLESIIVVAPGKGMGAGEVTIDGAQLVGNVLYVQATIAEGDAKSPYAAAVINKKTGVTLRSDFR